MSSKKIDQAKSVIVNVEIDPTECPFREFRDTELSTDYWGLGPAALRAAILSKVVPKLPADYVWNDDQTQPLPRSVRQYLHGWIRAEELAWDRWEADVAVFEDNENSKMSIQDTQLSHAQVLLRSSFCRRVLSACFVLERTDGLVVEHQWENFSSSLPEGWRAKYHIYSPGIKPGGGSQHRPGLSKSGCYLVRLYYLGAWRCVWVSDQVPVDATDSPLLPFSPLLSTGPKTGIKSAPNTIMSSVVHLWPLLICKALLKLAAPDMNSDENSDCVDDEVMPEFNILHSLSGALELNHGKLDIENLWDEIVSEVPVFAWDDDDDTLASTVKSRSTKKPATKETANVRRTSIATVTIQDTKNLPPYSLPGITPCHETALVVFMARDVPMKKPLPEPEVAFWKYYRWVDWARRHGLYEAYDCPRTRFLKVNGLLKLSYAPHLLDVQSTESIKKGKDANRSNTGMSAATLALQKEELREWVQYDSIQKLIINLAIIYFPSMFQFTSSASAPPVRITKGPPNRALDIVGSKSGPLYLQIDGPEDNVLRLSLSMLHPRILMNSGVPVMEYIEPAYLILEMFEWFLDSEIPKAKAFVTTRGYDTVQVGFLPGRHFCRLWIHSRMNWHASLLSESSLLLGTRDLIMSAAVRECPWVTRFLNNLGTAFANWIRVTRSNTNILMIDREFYRSYQPDLTWDPEVIGYEKHFLHWMFRKALQSLLHKKMPQAEFEAACIVLRRYFCDPDFGLPNKPPLTKSVREIVAGDPCDCLIPEPEGEEIVEESQEEQLEVEQLGEEKPLVRKSMMDQLLLPPEHPITSQVCELATEELPCGILKEEREKVVRMHEAATLLQAYWRGTWVRRSLKRHVIVSPEIYKSLMEHAFGTMESLSTLMNEFFNMYPGAKYAYSVASGLSGVYGLQQHAGITTVTPVCKWVPYFQGVFFCHAPVKVHFDVHSSLQFHTVAVYNNDTGLQMPQVYGAHITFDFLPNQHGYTVMGHGTLTKQSGIYSEVHWQLTVLTCINDVFHICDNSELCSELPLTPAAKLHIDEIFLPNRRNILGGILISVISHEAVSFRAAATSPDLEMVAILRTITNGVEEEVARCAGKGELYWPYIRLQPARQLPAVHKAKSVSHANLSHESTKTLKGKSTKPLSAGTKNASRIKLKGDQPATIEPKKYKIEVICPYGWPLTLAQWQRVDEVRNTLEPLKVEQTSKKPASKPTSAKEKDKDKNKPPEPSHHQPEPGDAYVELECAFVAGGGATASRDDDRDQELAAARRAWDANEPGRNLRGAQIRKEFRAEFLEALPPPPSESFHTIPEEIFGEEQVEGEFDKKEAIQIQQGPSPATESGMMEMSLESEEEAKYLSMPDLLRDKFIPLYFVPLCTKEKSEEESVVMSADMAEAAKAERHMRYEAAMERMRELQTYNEIHVLGRQRKRCSLLEKVFVDSQLPPDIIDAFDERDDAITKETLLRSLSANKKKQDGKKK